jgi:hypothetical protein
VNGNGAKCKELADKGEAGKKVLLGNLDGQALFTGVSRLYAGAQRWTSGDTSRKHGGNKNFSGVSSLNKKRRKGHRGSGYVVLSVSKTTLWRR